MFIDWKNNDQNIKKNCVMGKEKSKFQPCLPLVGEWRLFTFHLQLTRLLMLPIFSHGSLLGDYLLYFFFIKNNW